MIPPIWRPCYLKQTTKPNADRLTARDWDLRSHRVGGVATLPGLEVRLRQRKKRDYSPTGAVFPLRAARRTASATRLVTSGWNTLGTMYTALSS